MNCKNCHHAWTILKHELNKLLPKEKSLLKGKFFYLIEKEDKNAKKKH